MIKVLFFGPVADKLGQRELVLDFQPETSVQCIYDRLAAQYPAAFKLVCFTALNNEQVSDMATRVPDHAELVFMSKFSGG